MHTFDRFLLAHFLPKLLGQACPSTISRSGAKGQRVNCFATFIHEAGEPNLVLLSIHGLEVSGLRYDGGSYSIPVRILLDEIEPHEIQVIHHYGLSDICYTGIRSIAVGLWTRWPYAKIRLQRFGNAISQRIFNLRTLVVRERLDVLRDVVNAVRDGADAVSALDLVIMRHGGKYFDHPNRQKYQDTLEQYLEYLVDTGELKKFDVRYKPTGAALKTLQDSEEQDRKHREAILVQWILAVLTFASVVMAAAQAGLVKLPILMDWSALNSSEKPTVAAQPIPSIAPQAVGSSPLLPAVAASAPVSAVATASR